MDVVTILPSLPHDTNVSCKKCQAQLVKDPGKHKPPGRAVAESRFTNAPGTRGNPSRRRLCRTLVHAVHSSHAILLGPLARCVQCLLSKLLAPRLRYPVANTWNRDTMHAPQWALPLPTREPH